MAGDKRDQWQAHGSRERPPQKDIGDGAASLFLRHNESGGTGGLWGVKRADPEHDQTNHQQG